MLKIIWIFLSLCLNISTHATPAQDYLNKFMQYYHWKDHLPSTPDESFITFISNSTPLSKRLREKWLYRLAYDKKWAIYLQYYQPSTDLNLQCYKNIALYQQGQLKKAIESTEPLWLNGSSQPKACNDLFSLLLQHHDIKDKQIYQRIVLALRQQNVTLAIYLLKQYATPHENEIKQLLSIQQHPIRITELKPSELQSEFYLYGLTRLVSSNMNKALNLWQQPKTQPILSHAGQQTFLVQVALYKALRNQPDAPVWFAKITPPFYNDVLLGAEIRFALKNKQWRRVESLIQHLDEKDLPCWQYWLARAKEAQGEKESATQIYQSLGNTRNYYGFLANLRVKKRFRFENEPTVNDQRILQPYHLVTDRIKSLYISKQTLEASRLLNDFVSELPKDDKSALLHWIDHDLLWHGKSVYLSNNEQLNNQLSLRFPLAYQDTIVTNAKNYQIPKALIYAIIRQESAFSDDVVSSAGAHGLMQLMPATAKSISKDKKIAYSNKKQLFSTNKNITIGTAYLQQLHRRFKNHPILVVAAYNAGPRQVVYWLKNHSPEEIDIWVETLPWKETRNYLKNVIAFYAVYQYRLQEKPDLTPFMKHF